MPIVFSKLGWNRISGTTAVLLGTRLSMGHSWNPGNDRPVSTSDQVKSRCP